METQRLTNLRRLHRAATARQEALRQDGGRLRAEVAQRRGDLERVLGEQRALVERRGPTAGYEAPPCIHSETVAVLGHAQRHAEWLGVEAGRLRMEMVTGQARLGELRAAAVVAAQEARVLERLIERLELAQTHRQRRAEQDLVDHFALRLSKGRLT